MIAGTVNIYHEAVIHLKVHGPNGQNLDVDTVIDTGFSGWLSLHSLLIAELGLSFRRRGRALLADGSETIFDIYEGIVLWDGQSRRIAIDAADTDALVGMRLLHGYELVIQVMNGGRVLIQALPHP